MKRRFIKVVAGMLLAAISSVSILSNTLVLKAATKDELTNEEQDLQNTLLDKDNTATEAEPSEAIEAADLYAALSTLMDEETDIGQSIVTTNGGINCESLELAVGETTRLKIKGAKSRVTWKSDNRSVATVDKKGRVTAKGAGKALVIGKVRNKRYYCSVTVSIPATGITLSKNDLSLTKGKSFTLVAKVSPSDSTDAVKWESANKSVASVSNGVVTGVSEGATTITATAGDYYAFCTVTVMNSGTVDPEPVDPDPVEPEPVDPDPVDPEPVDPDPEPVSHNAFTSASNYLMKYGEYSSGTNSYRLSDVKYTSSSTYAFSFSYDLDDKDLNLVCLSDSSNGTSMLMISWGENDRVATVGELVVTSKNNEVYGFGTLTMSTFTNSTNLIISSDIPALDDTMSELATAMSKILMYGCEDLIRQTGETYYSLGFLSYEVL